MIQGIQFFNKDIAQRFQDEPENMLKWITQVQLSPTPLARAAYCEKVLLHEVMLGLKQYVILGAGLDTFCFRHPELKNRLDIFEVDYPATQQFKRKDWMRPIYKFRVIFILFRWTSPKRFPINIC